MWQVAWAHPRFGNILASCSYDRKVIIWKEENGSWDKMYEYTGHESSGWSIFGYPGERIISIWVFKACFHSNQRVSLTCEQSMYSNCCEVKVPAKVECVMWTLGILVFWLNLCLICLQWTLSAGVPMTLVWSWPVEALMVPFLFSRSLVISSGISRRSATHTLYVWDPVLTNSKLLFYSTIYIYFFLVYHSKNYWLSCRSVVMQWAGLQLWFQAAWLISRQGRSRITSNALSLEAATIWSNSGSK